MDTSFSARLGALAGAVGAILVGVSVFAAGSPLKPDASSSQVIAYLEARRGGLLLGYLLGVIGLALLLLFLGHFRAFLAEFEGGGAPLASVALVSFVTLIVIFVAGSAPLVAVIWRGSAGADPQIARTVFDASNLATYSLSAPATILAVLASSVVIWRSGAMPRWIAGLGALVIAVGVVELVGLFSKTGSNAAGYAWGIGDVFLVIWIVVVSIAMMTRTPRAMAMT